ncbi:MAG: SRPBCC family protein [Bacteroidota bacterium]
MAVHSLKTVQKIPGNLPDIWAFFSRPDNLKNITPDHLRFNVISKHHGDTIYPGQIIEYKVSPLLGIPLYWMTEITHVKDSVYFIDEQRYGPYSMWHHQHHFKLIDGGVEMTDIVHYKIPFWFLGDAANALFIRSQLRRIFAFRFQKTGEVFGHFPGDKQLLAFSSQTKYNC